MKVAFMPPVVDIGPSPQYVQLILSVTNPLGETVTGICLNITVLPVDNQPPQVIKHMFHRWTFIELVTKCDCVLIQVVSKSLVVDEGGETGLSLDNMLISDLDSPEELLQVQLRGEPHHGALWMDDLQLKSGHVLTLRDLSSGKVRLVVPFHAGLCWSCVFPSGLGTRNSSNQCD